IRNYKGICEVAAKKGWINFYLSPEEPIIIFIVQEFYLILKEREAKRPFYDMQSPIKVRGVNVLVTERSIYQFYDAPYYYPNYLYKIDLSKFKNVNIEDILIFFAEGKDIWTYRKVTTIPKTFNQVLMKSKAKIW
ncbi:hypothetical protein Gotur_018655, partial [Gossypium turneri]